MTLAIDLSVTLELPRRRREGNSFNYKWHFMQLRGVVANTVSIVVNDLSEEIPAHEAVGIDASNAMMFKLPD